MKTHLYEDGEKVLIDGEISTVKEWSFIPRLNRFTYTIEEDKGTFYFERELSKIQKEGEK